MTNSTKLMPQDIWRAYEQGQDYKRSIGLFDTVRRNENFFCGKQWEGLRVKSLDPLIFNVLRRCVNLFISLLVSDDVAVFGWYAHARLSEVSGGFAAERAGKCVAKAKV